MVCFSDLQTPALHAAQQWKDRLVSSTLPSIRATRAETRDDIQEMWRVAKLARSHATIDAELQYLDVDVECGDQECKDKLAAAHDRFKAAVWSNFTLFSDTPLKLGAILVSTAPDFDICEFEQFDGNIRSVASSLVQELSKWPDFPVDGMTAGECLLFSDATLEELMSGSNRNDRMDEGEHALQVKLDPQGG